MATHVLQMPAILLPDAQSLQLPATIIMPARMMAATLHQDALSRPLPLAMTMTTAHLMPATQLKAVCLRPSVAMMVMPVQPMRVALQLDARMRPLFAMTAMLARTTPVIPLPAAFSQRLIATTTMHVLLMVVQAEDAQTCKSIVLTIVNAQLMRVMPQPEIAPTLLSPTAALMRVIVMTAMPAPLMIATTERVLMHLLPAMTTMRVPPTTACLQADVRSR